MELLDMFKKSTIYFLTLLLFMSFSELSLSEEAEEEIDIEDVEGIAKEEEEEEEEEKKKKTSSKT